MLFRSNYFGLIDADILKNWIFCFSILRNTCAHHGRVWNRRFPEIILPRKTKNTFFQNKNIYPNKIFAYINSIIYTLNIIEPNNTFKTSLKELLKIQSKATEKEMGFIQNWESDLFWK